MTDNPDSPLQAAVDPVAPATIKPAKRKRPTKYQITRLTQKKRNTKIDYTKALVLKSKGATYKEIGDIYGATKGAVFRGLKKINNMLLSEQDAKSFNSLENRLITTAKSRIIQHAIDPKTIKGASLLQATTAYCQMFDKYRLNTGQATSYNVLSVLVRSAHDPKVIEVKANDNNKIEDDLS